MDITPLLKMVVGYTYIPNFTLSAPQDGFGAHLLFNCIERKVVKIKILILIMVLYEQWVLDHLL